jgi:adenine phosphoribosyltransferase
MGRTLYSNQSLILRTPSREEILQLVSKINSAYSKTKLDRMKARLMANEVLRLLKPHLSYKDLNKLTGVPESILCRYVRGNIIPSYEQAINILSKISLSIDLDTLLRNLVAREKSTIIDLSRVLKDPYIIRLLTILLTIELAGKTITKIVATSESVLPLATMLGLELNSSIVLVKRRAYPGIQYYSAIIVRTPRESETIYIDKDLINRRDRVLVLADVVYSGKTLNAVLNLLSRTRATVVDIIVILALGNQWRKRLKEYNVKTLTQTDVSYPF